MSSSLAKIASSASVSLEDFQLRLSEIQRDYEAKIATLKQQPEFDVSAVDEAAVETQTRLADLVKAFQSQLEGGAGKVVQLFSADGASGNPGGPGCEDPRSNALYDNSQCSLDLDLAVYEGDRDSLTALLGDPQFVYAADEVLKENSVFQAQRQLLMRSLHLPRALAPRLHGIGDKCRQALGLKPHLEFHLLTDPKPSVSCYMPATDRIDIIVSSAALDGFDDGELAFAMGHQLGHTLYDHHRLPINLLLERAGRMLFPVHALKIFAWKRDAEITADRIGLICSEDLDAATSALFKLTTGTNPERLSFRLGDYCQRLASGEHPEVASGEIDPEDWHSNVAFNPVRLRALTLFSRSTIFQGLRKLNSTQNRAGGASDNNGDSGSPEGLEISGKSLMEASILELMNCFEPSHLIDRGEITQIIREFIFLGSYFVIHANGANGVDQAMGHHAPGVQALASILDPDTMQRGLGKVEGADEDSLWTAIGEAARELKRNLAVVTRLNIVKDLAIITFFASGSVTRQERDVLSDLAQTLDLRPEFVDQVLHSVVKGLD